MKIPFLQHYLLVSIVVIYIGICRLLLPYFNTEEFFIFSTWSFFSGGPRSEVRDITFNGGQTFLYRDLHTQAVKANVDIHLLFFIMSWQDTVDYKDILLRELKKMSACPGIEVFTLKGTLADHMRKNKELPVIKKESLCEN